MGEEEHQMTNNTCLMYYGDEKNEDHWKTKMVEEEENDGELSSISSLGSSTISNGSSSSDIADDASSSSNSCSSSLYDLSDLMTQLPIKRGLSMFYQGKSESFTSLSKVTSIEDFAKKHKPYNYRKKIIKSSKSYGGGLDSYKLYTLPRAGISKKSTTNYCPRNSIISSPSFPSRSGSFVTSCRPPFIPLQKS